MKSRLTRSLLAILVTNAVWLGLLLWSSTETLPVSVLVQPNQVIATVGGTILSAPATTSGNGVGFFLQGADPNVGMAWPATPIPVQPGPLDLPARLAAESSWTDVHLTAGNGIGVSVPACLATPPVPPEDPRSPTGQPCPAAWSGDWFRHPLGGVTTEQPGAIYFAPTVPLGDTYAVNATLLRPRNAAGLLVAATDGANGMLLYFRPENRDIVWYQLENGSLVGPVASAPYNAFNKTAVASVQDVLRQLLGGYPAALVIVLVMAALGAASPPRPLSRPSPPLQRGALWAGRGGRGVRPRGPGGGAAPLAASPRHRVATSLGPVPVSEILALLVALAGLALFLYVADALLERIPHVQDSVAYLFQAKTFALGRLWVATPPDPNSFMHEFIIMKDGRWFSKYPPGWPMVLALGVVAGAPWIVDPILGALSLYLLYRIGREVYGPTVGLLAAVLGLTAPFLIFLSGSLMAHTSGLFFTLLMVYGVIRLERGGSRVGWGLVTGAAFGMLFLVRPFSGVLVALPFVMLALVQIARSPGD
ncbi:MAG TPA: glycosyltransferase family 39 protein, partial [Chloroflexota bacterium]|nr:glycosyltransferase family 39 protein [Chloroflexota bacterium]